MFVLKKLFNLRDKGRDPDEFEKPFLEHLEDLRDVIVKVVITLMIATIGCYVFRGELIDILRAPMEKVWQNIQLEKLPDEISPDLWEQAKKTADAASGLSDEEQSHFYAQFQNKQLTYYAKIANYHRAAMLIQDVEKRKEFISKFPEIDQKAKDLLLILAEKEPSAALDAKGNLSNPPRPSCSPSSYPSSLVSLFPSLSYSISSSSLSSQVLRKMSVEHSGQL
jgi:sec-independent protein translocase protein TatC